MIGIGQFGIVVAALGVVLALMGLFPSVTGIEVAAGVGVVQFISILVGFGLLDFGALMYVRFTIYTKVAANLIQQIGVRLTLTGLVLAGLTGLADFLGFGSHARATGTDVFFGQLQALGLVGSLLISALGVMIYAVTGNPPDDSG
jgi:predicted amidohydrolase